MEPGSFSVVLSDRWSDFTTKKKFGAPGWRVGTSWIGSSVLKLQDPDLKNSVVIFFPNANSNKVISCKSIVKEDISEIIFSLRKVDTGNTENSGVLLCNDYCET